MTLRTDVTPRPTRRRDRGGPPGPPGLRGTVLMVACGTALVLVTYVTPMATVPRTVADLGAGEASRAWILSSMSVGLAAALLATGGLGDTHGRRRAYLVGLAALGGGALLCALAPSAGWFIGGRVVQGAGGGAVLACGLALLSHAAPDAEARGRATAVWGASVGVGISVGSVLAAALDVGTGWRESYVVVAVAALLLAFPTGRYVAESSSSRAARVDVPGLVLLAAAMTCAVAALTQGRSGLDVPSVVLGVSALVLLAGFLLTESRVRQPLVDLGLLREPRFLAATLGSLVLGIGMIGLASFAPVVVQEGLGESLWSASLLVLAWSLTSVATSLVIRRVRRPLVGPLPLAVAMAVVAAGQVLALGLTEDSSTWRLVPSLAVSGLATGVLNALLGREAVASVPADRAAMGSGANNTARYLGAAIGITLFTVVATGLAGAPTGPELLAGWNVAVVVTAVVTLVGALVIGLLARPHGRAAAVSRGRPPGAPGT